MQFYQVNNRNLRKTKIVTTPSGLTQTARDQARPGFFQQIQMLADRKILIFIIVVAVFLRIGSAVVQGNSVLDLPGIYDQISYDGLAQRVLTGHGFSFAENHWPVTRAGEPTAHWSYLYTLYLVIVYKVFGTYPVAARLIQALISGVFQTLLFFRLGTRLFNRTAGLVGAALSAVYIYFFYYAGALITETFYITGILWTFDCAFRLVDTARNAERGARATTFWQWLELGIAIAVTVLLRQLFLLFLPFLFIWLWWNLQEKGTSRWAQSLRWSGIKGLSVVTAILILMILPFTIRNYRAFGTFVLLNTNAGYAFFWGNHPIYGTHFLPILPKEMGSYEDLIPKEVRNLNEAALDKELLRRGIQFIVNDPERYVLLSFSRIPAYFMFWPSAQSGPVSNVSRIASFGIMLPFMLYGIFVGIRKKRAKQGSGFLNLVTSFEGLVLIFVLIYSTIHLLSWALIRYRLPVDAVLLPFAALGLEDIYRRIVPSHVELR